MTTLLHSSPDKLLSWRHDGARDYAPAEHGLPVEAESITQIGPGEFVVDSALIGTSDTALLWVRHRILSVGVTVIHPDTITFAIPVSWRGEQLINGEAARSDRIYMPGPSDSYHIRGGNREIFGAVLRRDQFIETVAALRGVGPEDVKLDDYALQLTPVAADILRRQLAALRDSNPRNLAPQILDREIFRLITDAYLAATPEAAARPRRVLKAQGIVRKAEERFMAAQEQAISLADLCAATGVSKSALYYAFHSICGEPPLEYFSKRRLMRARSILLNTAPERGAVKRAALDVGLTELGRFSVEYRCLFGEPPSATLNKSPY